MSPIPPFGSAPTNIAAKTHAATGKTTPADADELPLVDSAASNVLKKLTWANLKATIKAYTDTLYTALGASAPPNGSAGGDLTGSYPNPTLAAAGPGATGPLGSATVTPIVTIDAKGRVTALSSATTAPTNAAGGDLTGNYPNPTLASAGGGAAGPTGSATVTPIVTVDAKGRVTALSSATTVPTNAAGGDLTGNYPNPTLASAGPGATGPIGDATHVSTVTIDAKGRVTGLSSTAITYSTANLARSARSSNTILAAADKGQVICATAAYTQTLTAAATLGAGWWVIVKNDTQDGTTLLIIDPNSTETIDSLTTATMYSGETRLIECDGANFTSQMLAGGYAKFTPTGGNFTVPAGVEVLDVVCIGSGGQGGGGFSGTGAASISGGGGGGGGAVTRAALRTADFAAGATVTVTVGAGGTGSGTPTNPGANGATTSFGTALKAGGGGGGTAGLSAASNQGGGGGSVINTAATNTAGTPSAAAGIGGQASTAASAGVAGTAAEWGGASGGGSASGNVPGKGGGQSIFGGPGGGSGGGASSTVGATGGTGGANQGYTNSGGVGGGTGGASPATPSTQAATTPTPYCGGGGGGGGGGNTGVAGANGGIGGIGAGGGGGGASANGTGGTGGNGGAGECRVFYS